MHVGCSGHIAAFVRGAPLAPQRAAQGPAGEMKISTSTVAALFSKMALKPLASLNKESRPLSLAIVAHGVSLLFLPLAITAFYFSLAIIAFGAFGLIVHCRLGKMDKRSLESAI